MSEKLVQLVKLGYESWNRGDRQWVLDHMSPDVEWITPPEDPDPGTYRGYEGVERFWAQWRAAVGQLQFTPEEMIDAGEHVVVFARRSGRGEHSGLDVSDHVAQVFTFEGEKCVRVREFYDRGEALRSIGAEDLAES
jgi:ketosteroid isomerase-like protein